MTTMTGWTPMLAEPIDRVPTAGDWQMEPKFDGHRATAHITKGGCTLFNRRGDVIGQVPYIAEALARRCGPDTIVDGEIVAESGGWGKVQSILGSQRVDTTGALTFMAFDVLQVEGADVTGLALRDRRRLLEALFKGRKPDEAFKLVQRRKASEEYLAELIAAGYEGAVIKRLESRYRGGKRGGGWFKIKPQTTAEVECIGFYAPTAGSKYDGIAVGGMRFRTDWGYEGKAAGMKDDLRVDMYRNPDDYIGLIAEVAHHGVTDDGALRHPQFKRWRTDKSTLTSKREASKASGQGAPRKGRAVSGKARKVEAPKIRTAPPVARVATGRRRNYGAMSATKLLKVIRELENQGEAYHRCINQGSGDPAGDLRHARKLAKERGLS